jgi:hypothetical protein
LDREPIGDEVNGWESFHSEGTCCFLSNSRINFGNNVVFPFGEFPQFLVLRDESLAMSAPWGIELDENIWVLLNERGEVGVI